MEIQLAKNYSANNVARKNVVVQATWNGTLKDGSSVTDPRIIVQSNDLISLCNYMIIPVFGRKYFINDVITLNANICEIVAHVDVLGTYIDQLAGCVAVVARQENQFQLYLDDGSFKTFNNPIIITKKFPNGFSNQNYILAVSGS